MSELEPTRTYSNLTATDELRRLPDERGVEWKAWDGVHPITVWHDETYLYEFVEYRLVNGAKQVNGCPSDNDGHCELTIKVFNCTPEQAIAATLGSCNCSDNCTNGERTETCHIETTENWLPAERYHRCTHCGAFFAVLDASSDIPPRVCPQLWKESRAMSITDELREWGRATLMPSLLNPLLAIADRIDTEHEESIQQALMGEGGVPATDENMAEHGWVRRNKEHVIAHAAVEVTPHIDWSRMADELDVFAQLVRGFAEQVGEDA